jgi:hypothetical protein
MQALLMTEHDRPVAHRVPDDQAAVVIEGADPRAVCGRVFRPASLTAPIGAPCPLCEQIVAPQRRRPGRTGR